MSAAVSMPEGVAIYKRSRRLRGALISYWHENGSTFTEVDAIEAKGGPREWSPSDVERFERLPLVEHVSETVVLLKGSESDLPLFLRVARGFSHRARPRGYSAWTPPPDPFREEVAAVRQREASEREAARARRPLAQSKTRETSTVSKPTSNDDLHLTELGNSLRLVRRFGDRIRFCHGRGWFVWDGKRWKPDTTGAVARMAKNVVAMIWAEASYCEDDARRKALRDHATKSEKASAIAAMIKLAESADGVAVDVAAFDADPFALNVANGILDLRTRQLREHDPAAMCTKLAPVAFEPNAGCPTWERFLAEVLPDPEVRSFLQRWAGYQLTGVTRERAIVLLIGRGRNGKSVLIRILVTLMGDYATYAAPDVLMEQAKSGQRHPTELADLCGVRFAALSETKKGRRFDEETLKRLTGDEPIKARFMGRDFFVFEMQAKMVMAANHRPRVADTTDSIWDRLKEIPFGVRIPREREDKTLFTRLRGELPGVLRWAVEGCQEWQRDGLGTAQVVAEATNAYRATEDPFIEFFSERVVFGGADDSTMFVSRKDLREAYQRWCEGCDRIAASAQDLVEAMTSKGCVDGKRRGLRFWRGARLRTEAEVSSEGSRNESAAPTESGAPAPCKTAEGAGGTWGQRNGGCQPYTASHESDLGSAAPICPPAPPIDSEGDQDLDYDRLEREAIERSEVLQ